MATHPDGWLTGLDEIERVVTTRNLLNSDPPLHDRLRRKVRQAFSPGLRWSELDAADP